MTTLVLCFILFAGDVFDIRSKLKCMMAQTCACVSRQMEYCTVLKVVLFSIRHITVHCAAFLR